MRPSEIEAGKTYSNRDDTVHRRVTQIDMGDSEYRRIHYINEKHFDPKWRMKRGDCLLTLFALTAHEEV